LSDISQIDESDCNVVKHKNNIIHKTTGHTSLVRVLAPTYFSTI